MIDIKRALKSPRLMKALTGLLPEEFERLKGSFSSALKERAQGNPTPSDQGSLSSKLAKNGIKSIALSGFMHRQPNFATTL